MIEIVSIDLSNHCSKGCSFCYNNSNSKGSLMWQADEVVRFISDCIKYGVKAVSFGGGEPFEYAGIFDIISTLKSNIFISVTSNGLPLLHDNIFNKLLENKPDKIHFTIHNPEIIDEVNNVLFLIDKLYDSDIKTGVNLLISASKIKDAHTCTNTLYKNGLTPDRIIFIPQKYNDIPTPKQIAYVASTPQFQSPGCLTTCTPGKRFCSVSWDKKVNFCSYSPSKQTLEELTYMGLMNALNKIKFKSCLI